MMEVESKTSILDLNLHVLDKIFDELKELKDKISLGRCHPLLSDAFAFHVRNLFKDLSFLKLDKAELSFILEWCGTTVESIDVRSFNLDDGDLIVRLAAKHCPNLYYIQILLAPENVKTIEQNLADLSQIQYVDLINYSNNVHVDIKNILKTLLKLPDLCGICVETSNWELTYNPNDIDLELSVVDGNIEESSEVCRILWGDKKYLSIEGASEGVTVLSNVCPKVEYINFTGLRDYYNYGIGHFPNLKKLEVACLARKEDCYGLHVQSLCNKYNYHLESLVINSHMEGIKSARRLSKMKALKTFECFEIESKCIKHIARIPLESINVWSIKRDDFLVLIRGCKTIRHFTMAKDIEIDIVYLKTLLHILWTNGVQPDKPFVLTIRFRVKFMDVIQTELAANSKGKLFVLLKGK